MPIVVELSLEQEGHGRVRLTNLEALALHAYLGRILMNPPPVGKPATFPCGSVTLTAVSGA